MASFDPSASTAPLENQDYDLDEYLGREEVSPVSASAREEAARSFVQLGADIAMAGVKAGQSSGTKNRSIDDLLLGVILPLLILAIAVAAMYIVLVFDSGKDQKLVDAAAGFLFSLPNLVFGYLLGRRHKEGSD
jgi:hypothetical protein